MKKLLKYVFISFISLIATYVISALVLESVFVGNKRLNDNTKFMAYVSSSDIHTEFVFPVSNDLFNWTELIPVNLVTKSILAPKYISIGWGSKDFFFNMRTWDEINFPVVFGAIFFPGESTLHVEYLENLDKTSKVFPLYLTKNEYLDLITFIKDFFILDAQGKVQKISEFSYYETDKFFKSRHSYHMFNTCNMWTLKGLEKINWKRPVWSPSKYGIENALSY